eukprot:EG_transcript_58762
MKQVKVSFFPFQRGFTINKGFPDPGNSFGNVSVWVWVPVCLGLDVGLLKATHTAGEQRQRHTPHATAALSKGVMVHHQPTASVPVTVSGAGTTLRVATTMGDGV